MRQLLLAEDNEEMARWVAHALRSQGLTVSVVHDGLAAYQQLQENRFDLLILDLSMPGMDGLEVLRRLRAQKNKVPVLVLTARNSVADRVSGLNVGADDYLPKPFDLTELEARVQALLRRAPANDYDHVIAVGTMRFQREEKRFYANQTPLDLTPREHAALDILFMKAGRVIPKETLFEKIFSDDGEVNQDAIEVLIHRLRKKLSLHHIEIVTLRGIGYLLKIPDTPTSSPT